MIDNLASELLAFANSLADESRAILGRVSTSAPAVSIKADDSFVTRTDREIEARLRERIADRYPDHGVLGEEYGAERPGAEYVWVLDPIDGTAAFIAGIPVHGTLIGVARGGSPWLGLVDHAATGERLTGVAGHAAWFQGRRIQCRANVALKDAFMTSSNPRFLSAEQLAKVLRLDAMVRFTQYGGSCYAYGSLARGRTDLAIDAGLEAFDIFAMAAIIEGAGGKVSDWAGAAITLDWRDEVLAAGDAALHAHVLTQLQDQGGRESPAEGAPL